MLKKPQVYAGLVTQAHVTHTIHCMHKQQPDTTATDTYNTPCSNKYDGDAGIVHVMCTLRPA